MEKPSVKCALLATMLAKHKWGTPISEENLISFSPIDEHPTAREVDDDLRSAAYIIRCRCSISFASDDGGRCRCRGQG